MNCALALRMLDAYIDDELDAVTAAEMVDTSRRAPHVPEITDSGWHADRVAVVVAPGGAPKGLRKSILREIEACAAAPTPLRTVRWWQALALGASTAVMGALGGWWLAQPRLVDTYPEFVVTRQSRRSRPPGRASTWRRPIATRCAPGSRAGSNSPDGTGLVRAGIRPARGRGRSRRDRQAVAVVYRLHNHIINVFSWRGTATSRIREGGDDPRLQRRHMGRPRYRVCRGLQYRQH